MKREGLFVVFEGLDQSGKKTLSKWLEEYLNQKGIKAKRYAFPNYNGPIGALIKQHLVGKIELSVRARHLLFAADRWQFYKEMKSLVETGVVVIADRYSGSGIAYGIAHYLDQKLLEAFEDGLLKPDVTFFVDIPAETSLTRKPEDRDLYEKQLDLLERVRTAYKYLAQSYNWITLNGLESVEQLSKEVTTRIDKMIGEHSVTQKPSFMLSF